jgi:hypothetical protein
MSSEEYEDTLLKCIRKKSSPIPFIKKFNSHDIRNWIMTPTKDSSLPRTLARSSIQKSEYFDIMKILLEHLLLEVKIEDYKDVLILSKIQDDYRAIDNNDQSYFFSLFDYALLNYVCSEMSEKINSIASTFNETAISLEKKDENLQVENKHQRITFKNGEFYYITNKGRYVSIKDLKNKLESCPGNSEEEKRNSPCWRALIEDIGVNKNIPVEPISVRKDKIVKPLDHEDIDFEDQYLPDLYRCDRNLPCYRTSDPKTRKKYKITTHFAMFLDQDCAGKNRIERRKSKEWIDYCKRCGLKPNLVVSLHQYLNRDMKDRILP